MSIKHKMSKQETELVSEKNSEWFNAEIANISLKKNYQDRFDFLHRHNYYKLIFS